MLKLLQNILSGGSCVKSTRTRLRLTVLEDRTVLSEYRWRPYGIDNLWANPDNWERKYIDPIFGTDLWGRASLLSHPEPGAADVATFDGGGNAKCIVGFAPTVGQLRIEPGYTDTITLQSPLTIASISSRGAGGLIFNSPGAKVQGGFTGAMLSQQTLTLSSGSVSEWLEGTFDHVKVAIAPAGAGTADATLTVAGATTREMKATDIRVDGTLKWNSGNVSIPAAPAPSGVTVGAAGLFRVALSGSRSWGVAAGNPMNQFKIQNSGLMEIDSPGGTAVFNGDFLNRAFADVLSGTLSLSGRAEQLRGEFTLENGATVQLTGPEQALRIYDGLVGSSGTIDGNLTLGYDPALGPVPNTSPVLRAGPVDRIGALTINQSLHIFSASATTQTAVGMVGDSSFVHVKGPYAVLAGKMRITCHGFFPDKTRKHKLVVIDGEQKGKFANFPNPVHRVTVGGRNFDFTYTGGDGNDVYSNPLGAVRGAIWTDFDRNGIRDGAELQYHYAPIDESYAFASLVNADTGEVVAGVALTASSGPERDGRYDFENVSAGRYYVLFEHTGGAGEYVNDTHARFSPPNANQSGPTDSSTDSDVVEVIYDYANRNAQGRTAVFTLGMGEEVAGLDAGIWWWQEVPDSDSVTGVYLDDIAWV